MHITILKSNEKFVNFNTAVAPYNFSLKRSYGATFFIYSSELAEEL